MFLGVDLFHRHIAIGEDANVGGDLHGLARDRFRIVLVFGDRLGRGERVIAARSDRGDAAFGLQHVAIAGQDQQIVLVRDDHQRFQIAQIFVGAPILGQFDRGAQQLAAILLQLFLEAFEQGEGIGGRARETGNDRIVLADPADLTGIRLHYRIAHGDLPVARDDDPIALAYADYGGAVPLG